MPETQENKVKKIISQVEPEIPTSLAIGDVPIITPTVSNMPASDMGNASINISVGGGGGQRRAVDEFGIPINAKRRVDEFGIPINTKRRVDEFGIPIPEEESFVIRKLRALKDFIQSTDSPIEELVAKIGRWDIPEFNVENLVERASRKGVGATLNPAQTLARGDIGALRKSLDITTAPSEALTEGLLEMVHETQAKINWDEARTKSVGINFALNMAREAPDVAAQFIGSGIHPLTFGMIGYGKLVSSIPKTAYGKQVLIPAIDATIDYISKRLPAWMVKPFTYKFGLPMKQEYLDIVSERLRNIKDWFDLAMETGAKLHDGISTEAQKLGLRLMTKTATAKDLHMMSTYTEKEWAKFGIKNTQKFFDDLTAARKLVDESSEVFLEEGIKAKFLNQKTADIIRSNMGKYLPRLYEIFENPTILTQIKSGKTAIEDVLGVIESDTTYLKRVAGYTEDQLKAFISLSRKQQISILNKLGKAKIQTQGFFKKPLSAFFNSLRKRGNLDVGKRKAMKEIETVPYPTVKTVIDTRTATENLIYFKKLSEIPQWVMKPSGIRPKDFVAMPVESKFGALSGKWVHKEIADDVLSIHKMTETGNFVWDAVTKGILATNTVWKANKVLFSPATHARNIISNIILLDLSGVPLYEIPGLLSAATKDYYSKGKYYRVAVKHDNIGRGFISTELGDFLPEVEQFHRKDIDSKVKRGGISLYRRAGNVYRAEEEIFKVAKTMYAMRNRMGELEASEEAAKWLFDYTKVSPITDFVRKNPIWNVPFFTFTAKAAPRIAEAMLKNPYKVYKYGQLFDFMTKASQDSLGMSDEDVEYIKEKKGRFGFLAPTKDQNGEPLWVSMKSYLPWGIIEEDFGKPPIPSVIAPGGVTALIGELTYNRIMQTGQDIAKDRPDKTMAMLGHIWKWFAPQTNPIPLLFARRRNVRTVGASAQKIADSLYGAGYLPEPMAKVLLAKKSGYYGASKGVSHAILDVLLGLRVEPIQDWVLRKRDAQELNQGLQDAGEIYMDVARDMGIGGKSGEMQLRNAEQMMQEKLNNVIEHWETSQNKKKE